MSEPVAPPGPSRAPQVAGPAGCRVDDDGFVPVAGVSDLWDGEMESYDVGGREILLVRVDGVYHAYDGICPHQSSRLVEGDLDGTTLTCFAHGWMFDVRTGAGVNPAVARLARHAVRTIDGRVEVGRQRVGQDGKADHGHS